MTSHGQGEECFRSFLRGSKQFQRGIISAEEFATYYFDQFAYYELHAELVEQIAALIPPATCQLFSQRIETALQPGYLRQAFAMGGYRRSEEDKLAAARRETANERNWCERLKPLLEAKLRSEN